MFLERPYAEVTVDEIVAEAGVAKGLAFYYFESKRGLYSAVVEVMLEQLVEHARPDMSLPPREREVTAIGNYVAWAAETEGLELILRDSVGVDARVDDAFRRSLEQLTGEWILGMADMRGGPGTSEALPPGVLSRSLWGWFAFARVVTADWLGERDVDSEELRDLLVGALDGVIAAALAATRRGGSTN
jgi:AcrR family transcriptional regulator